MLILGNIVAIRT